jgi:hypothetical protein
MSSSSKSGGAVGPFHSVAEAAGCVQTVDWMLLTLLFFAVLGGYHQNRNEKKKRKQSEQEQKNTDKGPK